MNDKNNFANFWPVKSSELKNFFLTAGFMFSVLFIQNILKILKDTIIIVKTDVPVTDVIKLYAVIPSSALLMIMYTWLIDKTSFRNVFLIFLSVFMGYFIIFAFVIFPNIDYFHYDEIYINQMIAKKPYFKWQLLAIYNWSFSIFYLLSELWPNIFFLTMFWQSANFLHTTEQAKRLYTVVSIFGNSASIVGGAIMLYYFQYNNSLFIKILPIQDFLNSNHEVRMIQIATIYIIIMAIVSIVFISYLIGNRKMMQSNEKLKLGFIESVKYIVKSPYIGWIFICSASFSFTMNMVEKIWKNQLKIFTHNSSEYMIITSKVIIWTGFVMIIMNIIGNNIMRIFGWLSVALFTPVIMLITGGIFFLVTIYNYIPDFLSPNFTILSFAVLIGAIQNIVTKGTKFALWDTSKEMLYIPLDQELKIKGKVSVDLVSSKVGKLISSSIFLFIFHVFPALTYIDCVPGSAVIFTLFCILWFYGIKKLNIKYQDLLKK